MEYHFFIPTEIVHGAGSLSLLHTHKMPGRKALIVTTKGKSVERLGYLGRLRRELELAGAEYVSFREVSGNPTTADVAAGADLARQEQCDFVVALGGGSAMDAGKAIALVAANGGNIWDYDRVFGGGKLPTERPLPLIAVPTTAGTGSEADGSFVINNLEKGRKNGMGTPGSFPVLSIVDPELMVSIPPMLTALQGFDVLFHAMECYFNRHANPVSDALALKTVATAAEYLPKVMENGADLQARDGMAVASTMAGLCLSTSGTALQHAIEHAMSGVYPELIHGCGLLLIDRAYLRRCAAKPALRPRMTDLARAMGRTEAREPEELILAMEALRRLCHVAELSMKNFGISPESFPEIVAGSHGRGYENDAGDSTDEEVLQILRQSWDQA